MSEPPSLSIANDAAVELEWSDGTRLIQCPEDFPRDGQEDRVLDLSRAASRGAISSALVRVAVHAAVRPVVEEIAGRLDDRSVRAAGETGPLLQPGGTLFALTAAGLRAFAGAGNEPGVPRSRVLVLIHGAFSRVDEAFSALLRAPGGEGGASAERNISWRTIHAGYPGGCFGFDHPTLRSSPLNNALELARQLPQGAEIDFLTHSRGGLVADLLAAAIGSNAPPQAALLGPAMAELRNLVAEKQLIVRNTVRVAAPARGTTLAGSRLSNLLNVFMNVIGATFGPAGSPVFGLVRELLIGVVQTPLDARFLPGLACLNPEGDFVRDLARLTADDSLTAITGDASRPGFLGRLRTLLPDLFFQQANDLVVDTAAMEGGVQRGRGATDALGKERIVSFRDEPGGPITHFSYFAHRGVIDTIVGALRGSVRGRIATRGQDRGYLQMGLDLLAGGGLDDATPAPRTGAGTVVLLPGIMGSTLSIAGETIWATITALGSNRFPELAVRDNDNVLASALLRGPYARIVDFLAKSFAVVPFAYDWRRSLRKAAAALDERLGRLRDTHPKGPIHLVGHSMGGLVARALAAYHPATWKQLGADGGRVLMLGTPLNGSWSIVDLLLKQNRLFKVLALASYPTTKDELATIIRAFPGVLELLPDAKCNPAAGDALADAGWAGKMNVDITAWRHAADVRKKLGEVALDERISYVAGSADETLAALAPVGSGPLDRAWTAQGDNAVTWASVSRDVPRIWVSPAAHGDLADTPATFDALKELLVSGTTHRLGSRTPPTETHRRYAPQLRGASRARELRAMGAAPELPPTQGELEDAIFGREPRAERPVLEVEVLHSDLASADGIVFVGHHGATLHGAEPSLDISLRGRLSERLRAGRYPRALGDIAVVPRDDAPTDAGRPRRNEPRFVVVLGLGDPGQLSRSLLREALRSAIVELSLPPLRELVGTSALSQLTFSLIGHGDEVLTPQESVAACLDAVVLAEGALRDAPAGREAGARIRRVRFVDLYANTASAALVACQDYAERPGLLAESTSVRIVASRIVTSPLGHQAWLASRPVQSPRPGRVRRVDIRAHGCDGHTSIDLRTSSESSVATSHLQPVDWSVVDQHCDALQGDGFSAQNVRALRAHVLPYALHAAFASGVDLQLVVDEETSRIPWEAFVEGGVDAAGGLTAGVSVVRQLNAEAANVGRGDRGAGKALVICPPLEERWRLPEAEREAVEIEAMLRASGFDVRRAQGGPREIRAALANDFEIVHIAGHGQHLPDDPKRSGILLAGGEILTEMDLRGLRSAPPALVFLSACHLAQMRNGAPRGSGAWASGVARSLMCNGVGAVVAAGWAVNDGAALGFARGFYTALLRGDRLRSAVAKARLCAREVTEGLATWAAFQVYGSADFALSLARRTQGTLDDELEAALARPPVAPHEARDLMAEVLRRINLAPEDRLPPRLQLSVATFWRSLPKEWHGLAGLPALRDALASFVPAMSESPADPARHRGSPNEAGAVSAAILGLDDDPAMREALDASSAYTPSVAPPSAEDVALAWQRALPSGARPDLLKLVRRRITLLVRAAARRSGTDDAGVPPVSESAPPLRSDRALITALQRTVPDLLDDPHAGRFDFVNEANGWTLDAKIDPVPRGAGGELYDIVLTVRSGRRVERRHDVTIHLHDTFVPNVLTRHIHATGRSTRFEIAAWGAFTVGAEVREGGRVVARMELDLASLRGAPQGFLDAG